MNTSKRATPLRPVTILPPSRAGSVTGADLGLAPLGFDQRARGRAADLFIGYKEMRDAER